MTITSTEERYLGNYRLQRLLGRGGQALVYLGEHRYLQRLAAIKVLHASLDEKKEQQFRAEAQLLASLSHPHIVRVLDFGIEQGTPFLVMDYAPQGSLLTLAPRGSCLALDRVVDYTAQVASALHYAHTRHIIHRDIKPENLLLDEQQQIMLSDFGLALLASPSDEPLSTQDVQGTLPYMAPEQIQGKPGYASDQYALAVMAYEWLAGCRPFTGVQAELIYHHCFVAPPSLREKNPAITAAVEAVIFKALAKEPAQRHSDVIAFALALTQASRARASDQRAGPLSGATGPMWLQLPALQQPKKVMTTPMPRVTPSGPPPAGTSLNVSAMQTRFMEEHTRDERMPGRAQVRHVGERGASAIVTPLGRNQDRQHMLARVRSFWITGFLEPSLQQGELIVPRLIAYPDAVANPWAAVLQRPRPVISSFPDGTRAIQVFDHVDGELLILGEPGAGKTTLALDLLRNLLARAERDESQPIPVMFNLSSWSQERLPLVQWLVTELNGKYQVPNRLAQYWIESNALLPVLDGLDEVAEDLRSSCILTINSYRQEYGLRPLVVCSRSEEYFAQEERTLLHNAIIVQPFTPQQVDVYLERAGGNVESLRKALRTDPALQELATTPLMLTTLISAYRDRPLGSLTSATSRQARQQHIFATYVEQALIRRQPSAVYQPQQTIRWLGDLARQMIQHNQAAFYLEQMQPDWIKERRWLMLYTWLAVRPPAFLVGLLGGIIANNLLYHDTTSSLFRLQALVGGFMGFLLSDLALQYHHPESRKGSHAVWRRALLSRPLINGLLMGLVSWLVLGHTYHQRSGVVSGISTLLLSIVLTLPQRVKPGMPVKSSLWQGMRKYMSVPWLNQWQRKPQGTSLQQHWMRHGAMPYIGYSIWQRHLTNGILVGFIYAVSDRLIQGTSQGWLVGLSYILRDGIRYGLLGILLSVLLLSDRGSIRPAEIIAWSWRRFWRFLCQRKHIKNSLLVLLYIGLAYGISYGISNGLTRDWLINGFSNGLAFGISYGFSLALCYWVVLGLFQGLSSESVDNRQRIRPNEGIRRSLLNMCLMALIGIGVGLFVYAASNTLYMGLKEGIRTPLVSWFSMGAPAAPSTGDLTFAAHNVSAAANAQRASTVQHTMPRADFITNFVKGAWHGWQMVVLYFWVAGVVTALLVAVLSGGLACLRHSVLRVLLWRSRSLPLNAPHFLDYAAERILLRKVGGGYTFLHPLLLHYFASLPPEHARYMKTTHRVGTDSSGSALEPQTKLARLL